MVLSLSLWAQEGRPGSGPEVTPTQKEMPRRGSGPAAAVTSKGDLFEIDPVHTTVIFKIQHMGVSNFYGRFDEVSGSVSIDAADPTNDSFDIQVKADSLDTNNKKRDSDIASPSFFILRCSICGLIAMIAAALSTSPPAWLSASRILSWTFQSWMTR